MNTVMEDIKAALAASVVAILLTTGLSWTFIASTSVVQVGGATLTQAGERLL